MLQLRNGQAIQTGQKVRVYRNLHKGLFSIQDYKSKKVIGYGDSFMLRNVTFKVSKAGRTRVLKTRVKNVHAFVEGYYSGLVKEIPITFERVRYNPFVTEGFINEVTSCLVIYSDVCFCIGGRCYTK